MNIVIKCSKCGAVLDTTASTNHLQELVIKVTPCTSIDCYDCSDCEEKQKTEDLKKQLDALKRKY